MTLSKKGKANAGKVKLEREVIVKLTFPDEKRLRGGIEVDVITPRPGCTQDPQGCTQSGVSCTPLNCDGILSVLICVKVEPKP